MKTIDFIRLIIPQYNHPGVMAVIVGFVFSTTIFNITLNLILAPICILLIASGYIAFNAIYDKKVDRVNKPYRPLASGTMRKEEAIWVSATLFVVALLLGILVNLTFLLIEIIAVALSLAYSHPKIHLKKFFVIGTLTINVLYAVMFPLAGWAINPYNTVPVYMILFLFVFGLGTAVLKDFEDIRGDIMYRVKTIPSVWGVKTAIKFSLSAFAASAIVLLVLISIGKLTLYYLPILVFIGVAMLNVGALTRNYNWGAYKNVVLGGVVLLTIMEIALVVIRIATG